VRAVGSDGTISAVTEWISSGQVEAVPGPGRSTWRSIPAEVIFKDTDVSDVG
jgi:hypothetical protein